MSNLTCPGCGSVYPISSVRQLDQFKCSVCHTTIVVPMAGPSPMRASVPAPAARPVAPVAKLAAPAPAPPRPAARHRPTHPRRAESRPARPGGVSAGVVIAGLAVVAAAVMAVVLLRSDKQGDAAAPPADAVAAKPALPPPPAPAKRPPGDPMKDVAAWQALDPSDRADRAVKYLAALDPANGEQLSSAFSFFKLRGDADGQRRVAEMEFRRDPSTAWARKARGDEIIDAEVDRCLAECVRAEEADTAAVRKLAKIAKANRPPSGAWWAEPALAKEIRATVEAIRADQARLQDPYEWALSKWDVYQRRIEVMRDFPAISSPAGPYLVFAQLRAAPGTEIENVESTEIARARRLLDQEKTLFTAFYDGFHAAFGAPLGLVRYDRTNLDEKTILKVNVFADETTWKRYHDRLGYGRWAERVSAYYEGDEPRFVVTYDPGGPGSRAADEQQCRQAVLQLLHFAAWDATRRSGKPEPAWAQSYPLPMSVELGLANFFAPHTRQADGFAWMQPDAERMKSVWVFTQVLQKRRWAMWSLDELLSVADGRDLDARATRRAIPRPVASMSKEQSEEVAVALRIFRNVYQAKGWSLVAYLLGQKDAGGAPLWRDRFLAFVKDALVVRRDEATGAPRPAGTAEFRNALGLTADADWLKFERDWLAWETATFAASKDPTWTALRDEWLKSMGLK